MNTDPNWLLSTVVQSTAVFVAIVAGFIISRLLALSAERGGIQTKIRDIKLQMEIKKKNLESLKKRHLDWDAENFLENSDVLDLIIKSNGQISLTEALKKVTTCNRSEDELNPYWIDAITITKNAYHILEENFSKLEGIEDLDVLLKNLGLDLSSYRLKIYHRFFDQLLEYRKRRNPIGLIMDPIMAFKMPDISTADEINRYRILERDIENFERDNNALVTQLSDLEVQLTQLGQPRGIKLGIIFLAYFSLVGIVIPVFLLPYPPEQFTLTHKWSIFLLFFSGLLFFFIYLFTLIRQLAETSDSDNSS
jgi:hypothetical protein